MLCRTNFLGIKRIHFGVLVSVALAWSPIALGDPIQANSGAIFRLNSATTFEQGCYDPCMCPISATPEVRGTLKLVYTGFDGQFESYSVVDVNWTIPDANLPSGGQRVTGAGTYRIGSPDPTTVVQHRMTLELRIGEEPVQHFDSGWLPLEDDSKIAITVSMNGMYCWDTVFRIDASRVPEHELRSYMLTGDSTFQRGCFDPCDCLLEEERPLTGSMTLVPLIETLPVTEWAVVDVDWHVLVTAVGDSIPITGVGIYQLLGDFALQHRLALELVVGTEPLTHFDSGVEFGGDLFPRIDAIVSINGIFCYDTVLHVVADPDSSNVCGPNGMACGPDEFCKQPVGQCNNTAQGVCTPIPETCTTEWDPVCGCNGVTYGNACEADAAGVSIAHHGECEEECRPADDGFGCATLACSDIPEEQCLGTILRIDWATGAITTVECTCMDFNLCHVVFGNATPFGVGNCPGETSCEVVGEDSDGDGVDDQFRAECLETGACCADLSGAPLPVPVCFQSGSTDCTGAGYFKGIGTDCDPQEACCIPLANGPYCVDADPFCCSSFGGVAGGIGSNCASVACGPACGGIAGIPCPDSGSFCKFPEGTCSWADMLGVCTPIPNGCPDANWDPVCGCDGVTYGNACEADMAGASIDHRGECERVCGGLGPNPPCEEGEFCKYPDGTCGSDNVQGVCTPLDGACPALWDPVCACNGVTYGNECEANAAGVSVAFAGECPWDCCNPDDAPPCTNGPYCCADSDWTCADNGVPPCPEPGTVCRPVCGGPHGLLCADAASFCKFPTGGCGANGGFGMCTPIVNNGCPEIYDPVCGCDGVTYSNACEADAAGVSIAHEGMCESPCSDLLGLTCMADMFCLYPHGTCDDGENLGQCTAFPSGCPAVYEPVCGCDGNTYGNACEAQLAGVSVLHEGECERLCGSPNSPPCEEGEFCRYPIGTCADAGVTGVCTLPPLNCPAVYDPVCGCDGVTYGNECEAYAASVSIAHDGECAGTPCAATRSFANIAGAYCPHIPQVVHIALTPNPNTSVVALEDEPPSGWAVSDISHDGVYDEVNGKVKWGPFFAPDIPSAVTYRVTPDDNAAGLSCFAGTVTLDGINEQVCGEGCVSQSCPPYMQSDLPQDDCPMCPIGDCSTCPDSACGDGRVSICELIGYACAWKVGCNDDLAGMARAAFVWRNGECYCWDDDVSNWEPADCPAPTSGVCENEAGRGNETLTAGASLMRITEIPLRSPNGKVAFDVRIEVDAPTDATVMAAEVSLPKGWTATGINSEGQWESTHHKVKWGPFFDRLSRTLTFKAVRTDALQRSNARKGSPDSRRIRLKGSVSFDGINQPIVVE